MHEQLQHFSPAPLSIACCLLRCCSGFYYLFGCFYLLQSKSLDRFSYRRVHSIPVLGFCCCCCRSFSIPHILFFCSCCFCFVFNYYVCVFVFVLLLGCAHSKSLLVERHLYSLHRVCICESQIHYADTHAHA